MSEHQPSPSEPDVDLKLLESRVDTMEEKLRGRLDSVSNHQGSICNLWKKNFAED